MKALIALALPLLAQSADRPAWDVAQRWTCDTDRMRICKGLGGACTTTANEAHFRIDFATNVFAVGTADRPLLEPKESFPRSAVSRPRLKLDLGERIVAREYLGPQDYPSGPTPGFSKLGLDSGDSFTIATRLRADGKSYDAILTRAQLDSQYSFFGACRPA
jgi:hypothetical protein